MNGLAFAGNKRFINVSFTNTDDAVDRNFVAGPQSQFVARDDFRRPHFDFDAARTTRAIGGTKSSSACSASDVPRRDFISI